MDLLERFKLNISANKLFGISDKFLLAVSGGVDSVVLCELFHRAGYSFAMAHCNFQLRGEESNRDEHFVRELAEKYGAPFYVQHFDTTAYAASHKVSVQAAARELRYHWFFELVGATGSISTAKVNANFSGVSLPPVANVLVTAHHADDNIETVLMNFFKGTGISGLRGMLPRQQQLARPLLPFRKTELQSFATVNKLQWVEDSSNTGNVYTRNYFRHKIIPLVEDRFPEATNNLLDNIERFREIEILYRQSIEVHKSKLVEQHGNEWHIPVLKLQRTAALPTVLYELLKDYGFSVKQSREAIALLDSESGRFIQSGSHRLIRNRKWLVLSPLDVTQSAHVLIQQENHQVDFAAGTLQFHALEKTAEWKLPTVSSIACLDARRIEYPLLLRKWKMGDYFYPLGMKKKKKVARFLIDQKLSKTTKENVWVMEMKGKILWIVGYRIDERFKVTDTTQKVLQVVLKAL